MENLILPLDYRRGYLAVKMKSNLDGNITLIFANNTKLDFSSPNVRLAYSNGRNSTLLLRSGSREANPAFTRVSKN